MTESIVTVKGEIKPEQLGFCQPHEHLFCAAGIPSRIYPPLLIDDIEKSAAEAKMYFSAGGRAVADAQPVFTGRDAVALREISEASGVHIIASTGFHKLVWYGEDSPMLKLDEEKLADVFSSEISEGMFAETSYADTPVRTDIRAGQIKTALEKEFTETHRKLFSAAAKASVQTGAPVMIHIDESADPLMILDFLLNKGVGANKQIFCHLDRFVGDITIHKEIAKAGAYLEYDTIARPKYHSEEKETAIILDMLHSGFEDQMLMSLDTTRERMKSYGGAPGLDYILASYLPKLKKYGVDDNALKKIFTTNTAAVFAR